MSSARCGNHARIQKTSTGLAGPNSLILDNGKEFKGAFEHGRIAFRRQYFTGRRTLQASLDRFLQFYNHERTHRGYRLRGRTPATVLNGAVAA